MLDNALLMTILFIIVTTIVSAIISSRRRDRCLTSFRGFMVTLLEKDGKRVWGNLAVEASGLELVYSEDYLDKDHIETSYILFKEEYNSLAEARTGWESYRTWYRNYRLHQGLKYRSPQEYAKITHHYKLLVA